MASYFLRKHQFFMLAFAELRVELEVAQVLVVSQPPLAIQDGHQGRCVYPKGQKNGGGSPAIEY
jgi:hypothetical protein